MVNGLKEKTTGQITLAGARLENPQNAFNAGAVGLERVTSLVCDVSVKKQIVDHLPLGSGKYLRWMRFGFRVRKASAPSRDVCGIFIFPYRKKKCNRRDSPEFVHHLMDY